MDWTSLPDKLHDELLVMLQTDPNEATHHRRLNGIKGVGLDLCKGIFLLIRDEIVDAASVDTAWKHAHAALLAELHLAEKIKMGFISPPYMTSWCYNVPPSVMYAHQRQIPFTLEEKNYRRDLQMLLAKVESLKDFHERRAFVERACSQSTLLEQSLLLQ